MAARRFAVACSLVVCAVLVFISRIDAIQSPEGFPVHRWLFEEESSDNTLFDEAVGAVAINGDLGKKGPLPRQELTNCAGTTRVGVFDGGQSADLGTSIGNFGTNDFTIAFWMNSLSTQATVRLVSNRQSATAGMGYVDIAMVTGALTFTIRDTAGTSAVLSTAVNVRDGGWHHIAARRLGIKMALLVDGVIQGSFNSASTLNVAGNTVSTFISNGLQTGYVGLMDDVQLYMGGVNDAGIRQLAHERDDLDFNGRCDTWRAYVSNSVDNTVSVVNLNDGTVQASVAVAQPQQIAVSGTRAFIASQSGSAVAAIDLASNADGLFATGISSPSGLAVVNNMLVLTSTLGGHTSAFDLATGAPLPGAITAGAGATRMGVWGDRVWIPSASGPGINQITTSAISSGSFGASNSFQSQIAPAGVASALGAFFVAQGGSQHFRSYSVVSLSPLAINELPDSPTGLSASPRDVAAAGTRVFLPLSNNTLYIYDRVNSAASLSVATDADPKAVAAFGGKVFVAARTGGAIDVFDQATGARLDTFTIGGHPSDIAIGTLPYAAPPVATVTSTNPVSVFASGAACTGKVNVTGTGTGAAVSPVTFAWMLGSTLATSANATLNLQPGTNGISFFVKDAMGRVSAPGTLTATVIDAPPVINGVPPATTVPATGPSGAVVNLAIPTATDACDPNPTLTATGIPVGQLFPVGATTVTYTAKDHAFPTPHTTVATVIVTVTAANTAPTLSAAGNVVVNEGGTAGNAGTYNDANAGDTVVITASVGAIATTGTNSGAWTWSNPAPNGPATYSVTITANDGTAAPVTTTFTVTVNNVAPVANSQSLTTAEDTALPITLTGSDAGNDPITFAIVTAPAHGSLSGVGANVTYTPNADYFGPDTFTFKTNDGLVGSIGAGTVTLTVTPVNDAPVAFDHSYTTHDAAPVSGSVLADAPAAFDVDQDALTAALVNGPQHGVVTLLPNGTFTFTPNGIFAGGDTFTYRVSDGTVTSAIATVHLTVTDTIGPTISAVPDIVQEATAANGASVHFVKPQAHDLVSGDVDTDCDQDPDSVFSLGDKTVTCTAHDASGNATTVIFHIRVVDTIGPIFTVMTPDMETEAEGPAGAHPVWGAPRAIDTVSGDVAPTCDYLPGSPFPLGVTTVTCTARDASNNSTVVTFRVTVRDTTPPVVTRAPDPIVEADGPDGALVNYPMPTAMDVVDGLQLVTCEHAPSGRYAIGTTDLHCSVADSRGNATTFIVKVTVKDTIGPIFTVMTPDMDTEAEGPAGAHPVWGAPSATDAVNGVIAPTCDHLPGSAFPLGVTTVTCTARDASNNSTVVTFRVTVKDTIGPIFTTSTPDLATEATGPAGASVHFVKPQAHDVVSGDVDTDCDQDPDSVFSLGDHTVTCTAKDERDNPTVVTFLISVRDTTAPTFDPNAPDDEQFEATGPNGITIAFVKPHASDVVDGYSVDTDCNNDPDGKFPLGITSVTCTARDAHGNTSTHTTIVRVIDSTGPVVTRGPDPVAEATGPDGAFVDYPMPTAMDVVDGLRLVTCEHAPSGRYAIGTTDLHCSVADSRGNMTAVVVTVRVVDTVGPAIVQPLNLVVEATGPAGASVHFLKPQAHDVVSGDVDTDCSQDPDSVFSLGDHTVTCTAKDERDNPTVVTFLISVRDTKAPTFDPNAPDDEQFEATGPNGITIAFVKPHASDIVDGYSVDTDCNADPDGKFPLGITSVTCTARDAHGNTATHTTIVRVIDSIGPVVTRDPDPVAEATGPDGGLVNYPLPTAVDVVDGLRLVTCEHAPSGRYALGITNLHCSVADSRGNTTTFVVKITVVDTTKPVITITTPGSGASYVVGSTVAANYSCADGVSGIVSCAGPVANGAAINTATVGSYLFLVTAVDGAGNSTSASVNYTVTAASATPGHMVGDGHVADPSGTADRLRFAFDVIELAGGQERGRMNVWTVDPSERPRLTNVFDATSFSTVVFSDDPAFTSGRRQTAPTVDSVTVTGTGEFNDQPGFTFTMSATDRGEPGKNADTFALTVFNAQGAVVFSATGALAGGNVQSARLPNRKLPPFIMGGPDHVREIEATSAAGATYVYPAVAATDMSGAPVPVVCAPASGSLFPIGRTRGTCTATDTAGRTSTLRFAVVVRDNTAPTFPSRPADITLDATSNRGAVVNYTEPLATDVVDANVAVTCKAASGKTFAVGATTVTCTAKDNAGNTASTSFVVTVNPKR